MLELEMMIAGDMEDSESKMEQDNEEAERERREKEEKVGYMRAAASMFLLCVFLQTLQAILQGGSAPELAGEAAACDTLLDTIPVCCC